MTTYPNKHEFIKNNLLNATLNFQHRLRMLLKNVMLSRCAPLTLSHYNYRIEFLFRGGSPCPWNPLDRLEEVLDAPHPRHKNIVEGLNCIKSGDALDLQQKSSLEKFADLFDSVSLKDPASATIVSEVNVHNHTAKACRKYGTTCRFNFPKYPIHKTIISTPSFIKYPEEKERREKMAQHTLE